MGGVSKTGSNFVVAFSLPKSQSPEVDGYVVINAPSVREFSMSFSLNAMPTGHATCTLNHPADIPVAGSYGSMVIQEYGADQKDDKAFGITSPILASPRIRPIVSISRSISSSVPRKPT